MSRRLKGGSSPSPPILEGEQWETVFRRKRPSKLPAPGTAASHFPFQCQVLVPDDIVTSALIKHHGNVQDAAYEITAKQPVMPVAIDLTHEDNDDDQLRRKKAWVPTPTQPPQVTKAASSTDLRYATALVRSTSSYSTARSVARGGSGGLSCTGYSSAAGARTAGSFSAAASASAAGARGGTGSSSAATSSSAAAPLGRTLATSSAAVKLPYGSFKSKKFYASAKSRSDASSAARHAALAASNAAFTASAISKVRRDIANTSKWEQPAILGYNSNIKECTKETREVIMIPASSCAQKASAAIATSFTSDNILNHRVAVQGQVLAVAPWVVGPGNRALIDLTAFGLQTNPPMVKVQHLASDFGWTKRWVETYCKEFGNANRTDIEKIKRRMKKDRLQVPVVLYAENLQKTYQILERHHQAVLNGETDDVLKVLHGQCGDSGKKSMLDPHRYSVSGDNFRSIAKPACADAGILWDEFCGRILVREAWPFDCAYKKCPPIDEPVLRTISPLNDLLEKIILGDLYDKRQVLAFGKPASFDVFGPGAWQEVIHSPPTCERQVGAMRLGISRPSPTVHLVAKPKLSGYVVPNFAWMAYQEERKCWRTVWATYLFVNPRTIVSNAARTFERLFAQNGPERWSQTEERHRVLELQ
ncbi:hypothetical protein HDU88_003979 [Geranomyces variabilis]|nr:hypothetical protein HDU88_003979 [Geranomyces variabilis]